MRLALSLENQQLVHHINKLEKSYDYLSRCKNACNEFNTFLWQNPLCKIRMEIHQSEKVYLPKL
jgi:hypothetical protein